jgi:hypothetical protein
LSLTFFKQLQKLLINACLFPVFKYGVFHLAHAGSSRIYQTDKSQMEKMACGPDATACDLPSTYDAPNDNASGSVDRQFSARSRRDTRDRLDFNRCKEMGREFDFDSGYMASIPVHSPDNDGRVYREVRYLASIAYLYRTSHIKLLTSAELFAEQFRQPVGRFQGYEWADYSVFKGMQFDSVDGFHMDIQYPAEKQRQRIDSCTDPLFLQLRKALGEPRCLAHLHRRKTQPFCFSTY